MQKEKSVLFSIQKVFLSHGLKGELIRYTEAIAYFTDFKSALKEKEKYKKSFVFPFKCKFYKNRRKKSGMLRANFH